MAMSAIPDQKGVSPSRRFNFSAVESWASRVRARRSRSEPTGGEGMAAGCRERSGRTVDFHPKSLLKPVQIPGPIESADKPLLQASVTLSGGDNLNDLARAESLLRDRIGGFFHLPRPARADQKSCGSRGSGRLFIGRPVVICAQPGRYAFFSSICGTST